jgi:hypothetical protein
LAGALNSFQNIGWFGGPNEVFGVVVVLIDVVADGHDQLLDFAEDASPSLVLSEVTEASFTMLSHELLMGVKYTWKCGWRASHFWGEFSFHSGLRPLPVKMARIL